MKLLSVEKKANPIQFLKKKQVFLFTIHFSQVQNDSTTDTQDIVIHYLNVVYVSLQLYRSKEKEEVLNSKRRMHRSLKFFSRRPFGRSDSYSEDEDFRGINKSVHFKVKVESNSSVSAWLIKKVMGNLFVFFMLQDAPMDLTDINPTIISTDTEDEDQMDGACPKLKRKPSKLSFKNPVVRWFHLYTPYLQYFKGARSFSE